MKMNRIFSAVMTVVLVFTLAFTGIVVVSADENTSDIVAYVNFYGDLDSKYASFIDGISLGITDKNDPLYFEKVSLDGLEARKQYTANSTYINIEDAFYEKGDTEFLVNICYYDFGPSEGSYYLEYPTTSGIRNQVRIYKSGRNPGWKYATVVLPDCDMSVKYENGASLRIQNGAYNAWHRIEIVNITKSKREKIVPTGIMAYGSIKKRDLEKSQITVLDDPMFSQENSLKQCSAYDAMTIANRYAMNGKSVSTDNKQKEITQGELIKIFMDALDIKYANATDIVKYATEIGFVKKDSAFLFDNAPATYADLEMLMDDVLYYTDTDGIVQIKKMYENGFWGDKDIKDINNEVLISAMQEIDDDIAYINFHGSLENRHASFIDGISLGITDASNPLYFEKVSLDGLEARKQYAANSTYINIDDAFYEKDDTKFLVNICYYDFGPSEGSYYLEYPTTSGILNQVRIYKPGRNPGWKYATVILPDCDMSAKYENGASLRIQNGAYNAWRRIEIVNISKHIAEKRPIKGLTAFGSLKKRDLERSMIINTDYELFSQENSAKYCSYYDAKSWAQKYAVKNGEVTDTNKEREISQGELLTIFMNELGIECENKENIVEYALKIGFIKSDSLFLYDDAPATYLDLELLLDDILYYTDVDGVVQITKMYEKGFWGDKDIKDINNTTLISEDLKKPKFNPYKTIVDNGTGRSYKYINFFGSDLTRPYLTSQQWLPDGVRFICLTPDGSLYLYNTETQYMQYIGMDNTGNGMGGIVGPDGYIYYSSKEGPFNTLVRVDPDDEQLRGKVVYRFPAGVRVVETIISNDGRYFAGTVTDDPYNVFETPEGAYPLVTFYFPEQSIEGVADMSHKVQHYAFPSGKGYMWHAQANPVYEDIQFFCHDFSTSQGMTANDIDDRINFINMETGEVITYNQGKAMGGGIEVAAHETWSSDGEYLYAVVMGGQTERSVLKSPVDGLGGLIRINKDGTHRQYYKPGTFESGTNHCFPSSDNKWLAADSSFVTLTNLETHQVFPIAQEYRIIGASKAHPYHAHAQIAAGHNIMSWGHVYQGVLGVAWYNFDDIANNEVAEGGRYPVNEYVERVSYKDLECESNEVELNGRICQTSVGGKGIFCAINPEIVDSTDDRIKITFDYLDNSFDPITLTYTRGIKNNLNDALLRFNAEVKVGRRATGKWKTAELIINSANCESIGTYETDFVLRGGSKELFVSNIKVEKMN